MDFRIIHHNHNVSDLNTSLAFYDKALGMRECRRKEAPDGSFVLVYLTDSTRSFEIELTWVKDHPQKYDLGECEFHLAFGVDAREFDAAHALHEQMGCICYENPSMGIYFIEDPDGYWLEIVPQH